MSLLSKKPHLIRNCRISESPHQKDLLVMPEGAIRLKGTGTDIIALCDGERTLQDILTELKLKYPSADPAQIETDAIEFLESLREKRVLNFK